MDETSEIYLEGIDSTPEDQEAPNIDEISSRIKAILSELKAQIQQAVESNDETLDPQGWLATFFNPEDISAEELENSTLVTARPLGSIEWHPATEVQPETTVISLHDKPGASITVHGDSATGLKLSHDEGSDPLVSAAAEVDKFLLQPLLEKQLHARIVGQQLSSSPMRPIHLTAATPEIEAANG